MARRYTVRSTTEFSAAHVLHGYPGACNRIHGHNFLVTAETVAHDLDEVGMAIDFTELEKLMASIAQELDHRLLNEVPPFVEVNPTAENIAAFFWTRLQGALASLPCAGPRGDRVRLTAVTVSETGRSSVTYSEDDPIA